MKLIDCLICDDVRPEIKGKFSLMGLYNDSINFETNDPDKLNWPISLRLALVLRIGLNEGEAWPDIPFKFEVIASHEGDQIAKVGGEFAVTKKDTRVVGLPVVFGGVPIPGEGELKIQLKIDAGGVSSTMVPPTPFHVRVRSPQ